MSTCKFCGEDHGALANAIRSPIPGFQVTCCPNVPQDHVYAHDEPEGKPNGVMVPIRKKEDRA